MQITHGQIAKFRGRCSDVPVYNTLVYTLFYNRYITGIYPLPSLYQVYTIMQYKLKKNFIPFHFEENLDDCHDDDCDDDVNYGYFDDIMNSDQEFSK